MIRTDNDYENALNRLEDEKVIIEHQRTKFKEMGYSGEELERLMQPLISFNSQLNEEVEAYEGMKRGNLGALYQINNIGRWLIGIRIALGMSQKEFAEKLGVSEAQVSRDEKNEYHGITTDKAQRILETFNIRFKAEIDAPISRSSSVDTPTVLT